MRQGAVLYRILSSYQISKFQFETLIYTVRFFILRNMVPTGIFLASRHDETTLRIELDFVTPEYRDFRTGTYIFRNQKQYFLEKGYSRFICSTTDPKHIRYLKKWASGKHWRMKAAYMRKRYSGGTICTSAARRLIHDFSLTFRLFNI